ncbi:MAG: DUF1553 domain-containing protein [Roseibacillus sp.]
MRLRGALWILLGSSCLVSGAEIRYNRDIRPLLSDNCFACHGPDANKVEAKLQLHSSGTARAPLGKAKDRHAIVPGKREESELWARITASDPDERMPPHDSHHELTPAQIELLGRWIDEGAKYEGHWSFQPLAAAKESSLDLFLRAELARSGLKPSGKADKATLLRRLTQDLTGLPPTPEEIVAFGESDDPGAYEQAVDRLLKSPAAAERLAVDWLDGARYADTNGYSIDDHRDMWIWRDWVIHAFLTNKPFDEFAVEQIAGDLLPGATEQQKVATGFLRNSMNTHEGGTIAEEYRVTYTADKVDTVATVFMGLTMKCAQCHDHKYDPITQKEYYQFFAFFNTSSEPGGGATNANTQPMIEAGSLICSPERVKRDVGYRLAELQQLRIAPDGKLAALRDAWEEVTLPTLAPAEEKAPAEFALFPKSAPSWIWAAANKTSQSAEFRREFELGEVPKRSRIWVTCDNECSVKINGHSIGSTDDWTRPEVFAVVHLKKGANVIEVSAVNGVNSPAGLLLSLAMRDLDGVVTHLATDKSWQARTPTGTANVKWEAAAEIAVHGGGPWGQLHGNEKGNRKGSGDGRLYRALITERSKRSKEDWKVINESFARKSGPYKTYLNQLNLEEKVIRKTADTGRATVMVMNYKPRKTHILVRGAYDQHGEEVTPGGPAILPPLTGGTNGKPKTRLDLARWLVDPAHPLTPRVIVNRYWQMLFGAGLVKTAENFGVQGEYPSHPELIDWLAADFVKSGWDLRRLLKQIVMSESYQQSSAATPELLEKDPYNRLLARAPRFRLGAEFVRDSALAASGLLNRDLGGPSVHPYQPEGLWAEVSHYGYPSGFTSQKFLPGRGRALYRRSIYTAWKRTSPPPTMTIFDAPNRETCTVRRLNTNTPLQALVLQNDPQFLEAARALGGIMAGAGSPQAGLEVGFARVLGRNPSRTESTLLTLALARYERTYAARESDAKALLSVGESQVGAEGNVVEMAAWTLVASTLLNMDEAVTRQ